MFTSCSYYYVSKAIQYSIINWKKQMYSAYTDTHKIERTSALAMNIDQKINTNAHIQK